MSANMIEEYRTLWKWNKVTVIVVILLQVYLSQANNQSPFVQQFTIKSHFSSWNLTKVTFPATRCFLKSRSDNRASVICDKQYNKTQIQDILIILDQYKAYIGSLDLTCALDSSGFNTTYKTCVCMAIQTNQTVTATHSNSSGSNDNVTVTDPEETSDVTVPDSYGITNVSFSSCAYLNILTKDLLVGYKTVAVLTIDNVPIEQIEPDALDGLKATLQVLTLKNLPLKEKTLPRGMLCEMKNLYFVLLEHLDSPMKQFPSALFACSPNQTDIMDIGLQSLIGVFATGNQFKKLPYGFLGHGAYSVKALNLTNNGISEISKNAFSSMFSLQELNLDGNEITNITAEMFSSLSSLLYLSLNDNKLGILDISIFQPLNMLKELHLDGNQISHIDGSFSILPSLREIYICRNNLHEINATTFNKSYHISDLYMEYNSIEYIDSKAFASLLFLQKLELGHNKLRNSTNLQVAMQEYMEYLLYLGLAYNELTEILPRQFKRRTYVNKIKLLDLKFNRIQNISEDGFADMFDLKILSLGFNEISEIKPNTFRHLTRLIFLWIQKNHLNDFPEDELPPGLVQFSMTGNEIKTIPHMSKPHRSLSHVYFGYNMISELNSSLFTNFPNLKLLNLTHCRINSLAERTFEGLQKLEILELSGNLLDLDFSIDYLGKIWQMNIVNISYNLIHSAENLFKHQFKYADLLDISSNPIQVFPDQPKTHKLGEGDYPNLAQIAHMYIRNCSLYYVHPNAFELMPNLIHLDLSDNELRSLERLNIVQQNMALYFVYLYRNPIHCNCHTSWLMKSPYNGFYKLSQCTLETTNQQVPFESVTDIDFLCEETTNCLVEHDSCKCFTNNATHPVIIYVQCVGGKKKKVPTATLR